MGRFTKLYTGSYGAYNYEAFVRANLLTGTVPTELGKLSNFVHGFGKGARAHQPATTAQPPTRLRRYPSSTQLVPTRLPGLIGNALMGTIPTELGNLVEQFAHQPNSNGARPVYLDEAMVRA